MSGGGGGNSGDSTQEQRQHKRGGQQHADKAATAAANKHALRTQTAALEAYQFVNSWPELAAQYTIVDKLGEGTFATVYKAVDVHGLHSDHIASASDSDSDSDDDDNHNNGHVNDDNGTDNVDGVHCQTATAGVPVAAAEAAAEGEQMGGGSSNPFDVPAVVTAADSFYCVPFEAAASVEGSAADVRLSLPVSGRTTPALNASFNLSTTGRRPSDNLNTSFNLNSSVRASRHSSSRKRIRMLDDTDGEDQDGDGDRQQRHRRHRQRRRRRFVALKRIYQTSAAQRILNEAQLLSEVSGHPNIASLLSLHRKQDNVVLVLTYFKHLETREYFGRIPIGEQRHYFKHLFSALAHIHSKNIIHRDVKPGNFLFNPHKRHGVLVDFGLAQQKVDKLAVKRSNPSSRLSATGGKNGVGGIKRSRKGDEDVLEVLLRESNRRFDAIELRYGKPGYLENDVRPALRANRAGTRGFRAPEVLLKVSHQTTAIDIWSVGVMLLCFFTRRFPFFNSNDDTEALQELMLLFGTRRMRHLAQQYDRVLVSTVPTITKQGYTLRDIVHNVNRGEYASIPDEAFDLLEQCLELDPGKRITAAEALKHPFLRV
ncbi:Cell division control protein 7 [Sorochytrium milnesiophthora]